MALFNQNDNSSEEAFTKHVTPLQVAQSIQTAVDASWQYLSLQPHPATEGLRRSVFAEFSRVESWWNELADRSPHLIVEGYGREFEMPRVAQDAAKERQFTHEALLRWLPAKALAEAVFWTWLLQRVETRDPLRTINIVRQMIDRELANAAEDIALFAETDRGGTDKGS